MIKINVMIKTDSVMNISKKSVISAIVNRIRGRFPPPNLRQWVSNVTDPTFAPSYKLQRQVIDCIY